MNQNNNKEYIINKLKVLINQLDLSNINFDIIKTNINKLVKVYYKLKEVWYNIELNKIKFKTYSKNTDKYNKIKLIILDNFLSKNENISKIIDESNYIYCLKYSNIYFYWISESSIINSNDLNYQLAMNMMKITISLNKYKYNDNDNINRIIIWIPINKNRNFFPNTITSLNLKKTESEFEAFIASGVTFGDNPKITIITRYEEVEKLLIHELIHNYNMDGSKYYNQMTEIISEYKDIKLANRNGETYNYDYEFSIYESYTELLSTYFYLLFENIKMNEKTRINFNIKEKLLGQILIELLYSYNLVGNLIRLNNYLNYEEFSKKIVFDGNICGYEYYYIKGLMYNNFIITFGSNLEEFKKIYIEIIDMLKKLKKNDDMLMKQIYYLQIPQTNFKYQIH